MLFILSKEKENELESFITEFNKQDYFLTKSVVELSKILKNVIGNITPKEYTTTLAFGQQNLITLLTSQKFEDFHGNFGLTIKKSAITERKMRTDTAHVFPIIRSLQKLWKNGVYETFISNLIMLIETYRNYIDNPNGNHQDEIEGLLERLTKEIKRGNKLTLSFFQRKIAEIIAEIFLYNPNYSTTVEEFLDVVGSWHSYNLYTIDEFYQNVHNLAEKRNKNKFKKYLDEALKILNCYKHYLKQISTMPVLLSYKEGEDQYFPAPVDWVLYVTQLDRDSTVNVNAMNVIKSKSPLMRITDEQIVFSFFKYSLYDYLSYKYAVESDKSMMNQIQKLLNNIKNNEAIVEVSKSVIGNVITSLFTQSLNKVSYTKEKPTSITSSYRQLLYYKKLVNSNKAVLNGNINRIINFMLKLAFEQAIQDVLKIQNDNATLYEIELKHKIISMLTTRKGQKIKFSDIVVYNSEERFDKTSQIFYMIFLKKLNEIQKNIPIAPRIMASERVLRLRFVYSTVESIAGTQPRCYSEFNSLKKLYDNLSLFQLKGVLPFSILEKKNCKSPSTNIDSKSVQNRMKYILTFDERYNMICKYNLNGEEIFNLLKNGIEKIAVSVKQDLNKKRYIQKLLDISQRILNELYVKRYLDLDMNTLKRILRNKTENIDYNTLCISLIFLNKLTKTVLMNQIRKFQPDLKKIRNENGNNFENVLRFILSGLIASVSEVDLRNGLQIESYTYDNSKSECLFKIKKVSANVYWAKSKNLIIGRKSRPSSFSLLNILLGKCENVFNLRVGTHYQKISFKLKYIPFITEVSSIRILRMLKVLEDREKIKDVNPIIQYDLKGKIIPYSSYYYVFELSNILKYGWAMQIAKIEQLDNEMTKLIIEKYGGTCDPLKHEPLVYKETNFNTYMKVLTWYLKWQMNFLNIENQYSNPKNA